MIDQIDAILREAVERIGAQTSCSLVLRRGAGLIRVASSDSRAATCDEVEVLERRGPCVQAMDHLSGVLIPDLSADGRWPSWRDQATQLGFRSAAALPAYIGSGAALTLNLYSDQIDPWDAESLVHADAQVQELAALLAAPRP